MEDEEYDSLEDIDVQLNEERISLIRSASSIVWDEAFSNHSSCLSIVLKTFFGKEHSDENVPKVLLLVGDNKQIAPVVKYGTKYDVLRASIISHQSFTMFNVSTFSENLRLLGHTSDVDSTYREYAEMLLEVGFGRADERTIALSEEDKTTSATRLFISCLRAVSDLYEALNYLHPEHDVHDPTFHMRSILAGDILFIFWTIVLTKCSHK